jgi:hypothetical protein
MIDYTPRHRYTEIVDKPVVEYTHYQIWKKRFRNVAIVSGYIVGWIIFPRWLMVIVTFLLLCATFVVIICLAMIPRQLSKQEISKVIKDVIGFDFGNDFKLLRTRSHDYEEYLYIFTEDTFGPLKKYLDSIKDGEQEGTTRFVHHRYLDSTGKERTGFSLVENRLDVNGCGNVEDIKVDYANCTLKHRFTVY